MNTHTCMPLPRSATITIITSLIGICLLTTINPAAIAAPALLRSIDELEDPRGYCLDVPGFGASLDLDSPITTHTCKYSLPGFYIDQLFEFTPTQQLRLTEYDRCLGGREMQAGSKVDLVDCKQTKAHAWTLHPKGRLRPSAARNLCLTLSRDREFVNTSVLTVPAYSTRSISLEECKRSDDYRQRWRFAEPHEQTTYNANTMRNKMPTEIARKIRELGAVINPPATKQLYASEPRQFSAADVNVSNIISYGPNPQHLLNVYTGKDRKFPQPIPVLVLVHGGGYTQGDINSLRHVATHFAALGLIVVNITYPLAPANVWPSGAHSVALAMTWVNNHIGEYNGDPRRVFVLGHSAGANHVAGYALRTDLLPANTPKAAGVILASPPIRLDAENSSEGERAYFGTDTGKWAGMQIPGNISRTSIPVLSVVAELDPGRFHENVAELHYLLSNEFKVKSRIRQLPGHNHISYIAATGTADRMFEEEVLDFLGSATTK